MSYFAANTVSIDREQQMFRVKGGDNNVRPRENCWTDWHPLRNLLPALVGGAIQLTTRSDHAVHIGHAAGKANARLQELTGLSAYTLGDILLRDDRAELTTYYQESIAAWQGDHGAHFSASYVEQQIVELRHLLDIAGDPGQLEAIDAVLADFCRSVCQPVRSTHVVTNGERYILRTHRGGARTTHDRARAKRYSEARAREVAARFRGWTVQEAA